MYFSLINIWLCQKKCVTLYIEKGAGSRGKMHTKQWVFNTEAVAKCIRSCGFSVPKQCTFDHEEPQVPPPGFHSL